MTSSHSVTEQIAGKSGRVYTISEILQDKGHPFGRVYLAHDDGKPVVLKDIPQDIDARTELYDRTASRPHVRHLLDNIPNHKVFVFDYLNDHLLRLVQKHLPAYLAKSILKAALQGLVALHEVDIAHNDIKPNNIMVQTDSTSPQMKIKKVELADLEDAAHLPEASVVKGAQLGNIMWRSPESHALGPISKPSDMFSFGIVCIYAMTEIIPFAVDETQLPEGIEELAVVIERQMSLFAYEESLNGFLRYIGRESGWHEVFEITKTGFGRDNPRKPFVLWAGLKVEQEDLFKDLVAGLTNFDPEKRLTAKQALEHEWFKNAHPVVA